ncbi:AraC family transcriptional regulator [Paenibacillus lutimineralis]|uniref:AraC family transcriptional regulator n=1 Tax=Paenibacillus lutimineralis TaxID=2707005 RepID=A0A3Q9I736_9BACL|nr:AraC family transcriptional regulator [Paenibacillus lutimineralis]
MFWLITSVYSYFNNGVIIEQDEHYITYKQNLVEGEGTASIYPLLSGIEIIQLDFLASHYIPAVHREKNILTINHCLEGRAECRMSDGCLQYIGEGDLFLNTMQNPSDSIELPLGFYHGIVVMIDLDKVAAEISDLLPGIPIQIGELVKSFFIEDDCFLIQSKDDIQHIFSGMYTIPSQARSLYFRIKIVELLLYLYYFDPVKEKQKRFYARQQVDIVKQIEKQMIGEPSRRFTIEELAQQHCISPTALKAYFKGVYGKSIAAYMKEYRIRQAASLLRETNQSVADIAMSVGYESQSKFGAAFKEMMKITPLEYRKKFF